MANKESSEAAKKIAKAEKEKSSKKPKKEGKKNIFKVIGRFFKDLKGEVKKITWPGAKEVLKGTLITLACIAVIGAVVCLVDLGLTSAINATREAAYNRTTETTAAVTTAATPVVPSTAAPTTTTAAESTTSAASADAN